MSADTSESHNQCNFSILDHCSILINDTLVTSPGTLRHQTFFCTGYGVKKYHVFSIITNIKEQVKSLLGIKTYQDIYYIVEKSSWIEVLVFV